MDNEQIYEKLVEFGDYLSKGTVVQDVIRQFMWWLVQGLVWIVDSLENVTDTILGLKGFYDNPQFVDFIEAFRPVLVVLLALSLLFIGYLLIFQKQFNREAVLTNIFVALIVIVLLGAGMDKADKFTGDAINAINNAGEEEEGGTVATDVVRDNIVDISVFDINGWESTDVDAYNQLSSDYVMDINIKSYLTEGSQITEEQELTDDGEEILSHSIETIGDGNRKVVELEDGNWVTDITKEYYYRYTVDWFNIIATLAILGFVLVTIAIKLAKLFFELAFNYVLASLVAPADLHSGQKTKTVIQNILSIFVVTMLIFLSMKVYMIGTSFLADELSGVAYIVAMIGFAMAVIDGPNIVERLFGIDAGMKSGWGALAGTLALGKGASNATKGLGKGLSSVAKGSSAVASKSTSGVAGMAGLVSGFKNGKQQNSSNGEQTKNESGNNTEATTGQTDGTESESTEQSDNTNPSSGHTDQPSGLHQEMAQKNKNSDGENGKPKPLRQRMADKFKGKGKGKGNNVSKTGNPTTSNPNSQQTQSVDGENNSPETTTVANQQSKQNNPTPSGKGTQNNPTPSANEGNQTTNPTPSTGAGNGKQQTTTYENQQSKQNTPKTSTGKTNGQTTKTSTGRNNGGNPSGNQQTSTQQTQKSGNGSPSVSTSSGGNNPTPTPTPTTGGGNTSGSEKVNTVDNTTVVSNDNTSTQKEVTKENNHVIEENRTAGQVIKERVSKTIHSNRTINNAKRNYQIGSNTGKSIRRNFKRRK
ncbi:pLS20_p028 family conjugation system transmembrane protein [Oceanobacillus sp. FSL K6-0251]|uniref:pLS20_p028 family conjugation system transmembrane protein n=2 Tax=Oceanobacillus TaxID=182709 RepID=UPI0030F77597